MKLKLHACFCFVLMFFGLGAKQVFAAENCKADLVVYSFDRPMQLYALLESIELYVTGLGQTTVIYRSSDDHFLRAYQEVIRCYPDIQFVRQGPNPHADFKTLTLRAAFDSAHDYILFAVDDIVVKDFIDVAWDIESLELYDAYAFYYRQGLHLTYCHPREQSQALPLYEQLEDDLYRWRFSEGEGDWNYPNMVDMALYRKKEIEHDLRTIRYVAPNTMEGYWSTKRGPIMDRHGLCHNISKIVNLPLNKVQTEGRTPHMTGYSSKRLLTLFNQGLKIDILPLFRIKNKSGHMDYYPEFVER